MIIIMAACMFCGTCFGEKAGAPNIVLFRFKFKVAAAGNDRELVCAAGTGKLVLSFFGSYSVLESAVADRILVAASRFLSAVAACVIRKSYWGGWIKVAMVSSQQILLSIGADHFPLKIPLKSASKSSFFALAPRSSFGAAISVAMARHSMAFCNSVSADRLVKAV